MFHAMLNKKRESYNIDLENARMYQKLRNPVAQLPKASTLVAQYNEKHQQIKHRLSKDRRPLPTKSKMSVRTRLDQLPRLVVPEAEVDHLNKTVAVDGISLDPFLPSALNHPSATQIQSVSKRDVKDQKEPAAEPRLSARQILAISDGVLADRGRSQENPTRKSNKDQKQ